MLTKQWINQFLLLIVVSSQAKSGSLGFSQMRTPSGWKPCFQWSWNHGTVASLVVWCQSCRGQKNNPSIPFRASCQCDLAVDNTRVNLRDKVLCTWFDMARPFSEPLEPQSGNLPELYAQFFPGPPLCRALDTGEVHWEVGCCQRETDTKWYKSMQIWQIDVNR